MNYPKILVISHNPFSKKQNNGKTLSAFFEGWPENKIAQLFLTLDEIDTNICKKFYRISDIDVLKSVFHKEVGREINEKDINKSNEEKKDISKSILYKYVRGLARKRNTIIWWLRTILWKSVKPWKKQSFLDWIKDFNPDVIFFQSSNFYPIFKMVEEISECTDAKIYIETTDDYVTPTFSLNPLKILQQYKMQKEYRKLVNKSECIFAIGDKMSREYKKRFGGNYEVAMNSIKIKEISEYHKNQQEVLFTYAGNLGLKRWKILYDLGKKIDEINKEEKQKGKLIICSLTELSNKILKKFSSVDSIEFKGAKDSEEVIKLREKSDILVHVEAFDRKNKIITRLSISTKIPEYMLSKRCILAIGPEDVASIEYILNNNAGMVITEKKNRNWKTKLEQIMKDNELRKRYADNAYCLAEKNHIYENNKDKVQKIIIGSLTGGSSTNE